MSPAQQLAHLAASSKTAKISSFRRAIDSQMGSPGLGVEVGGLGGLWLVWVAETVVG